MGIESLPVLITILSLVVRVCVIFGDEECCNCDSPNVKTVLFKKIDEERDCWEHTDIALLFARRIMQEIVPRKVPVNIPLMKEYFELAEESVNQVATTNLSRLLLHAAFADTVGGYLYAYGLPLAKEAYYEGKADYKETKLLHDLETRLKATLGTDGKGWRTPTKLIKFAGKVAPAKISTFSDETDPCNMLITNDLLAFSNSKDRDSRETKESRKVCSAVRSGDFESRDELNIPLPFLDDNEAPRALAVPFRNRSLYSLSSAVSAQVLTRYYSASVQCLKNAASISKESSAMTPAIRAQQLNKRFFKHRVTHKSAARNATEKFEVQFYRWIHEKIMPRLDDQTWYVGFGGVFRIIEAIRRKGLPELNATVVGSNFALPRVVVNESNLNAGSFSLNPSYAQRQRHRLGESNKSSRNRILAKHSKILSILPDNPSAPFYLCSIFIIIVSFWLISFIVFASYKVIRGRSPRAMSGLRYKRIDSSERNLDTDDTDVENLLSDDDEPHGDSSCQADSQNLFDDLGSSISDLWDKYLSSDNDIAVSSAGISYNLSDDVDSRSGRLSSALSENEDIINHREIEERKERSVYGGRGRRYSGYC